MKEKKYNLKKAGEYLVPDNEVSIDEMVTAIAEAHKTEPMGLIDYVDGVSVWEKLELELNCSEFLELIQINSNHYIDDMKLSRDDESLEIYIDEGDDRDPIQICYWYFEEWEEDAETVVPAMLKAMELFYTDKEELLERLNLGHYALGFGCPFEDWTTLELFEYLQDIYCIDKEEDFDSWMHSRSDMLKTCNDYHN